MADKKKKANNKAKKIKGKLPTKQYLNLTLKEERDISVSKTLIIGIAIVVILAAFGKFMVFDRITAASKAEAKTREMSAELKQVQAEIDELQPVEQKYAHYTYEGMTEEELQRIDRVKAMKMVKNTFIDGNLSKNWTLEGNTMTLQISGDCLEDLNQIAQSLEKLPIVEKCVIKAADKVEPGKKVDKRVTTAFVVYLKQSPEEAKATEQRMKMGVSDYEEK